MSPCCNVGKMSDEGQMNHRINVAWIFSDTFLSDRHRNKLHWIQFILLAEPFAREFKITNFYSVLQSLSLGCHTTRATAFQIQYDEVWIECERTCAVTVSHFCWLLRRNPCICLWNKIRWMILRLFAGCCEQEKWFEMWIELLATSGLFDAFIKSFYYNIQLVMNCSSSAMATCWELFYGDLCGNIQQKFGRRPWHEREHNAHLSAASTLSAFELTA